LFVTSLHSYELSTDIAVLVLSTQCNFFLLTCLLIVANEQRCNCFSIALALIFTLIICRNQTVCSSGVCCGQCKRPQVPAGGFAVVIQLVIGLFFHLLFHLHWQPELAYKLYTRESVSCCVKYAVNTDNEEFVRLHYCFVLLVIENSSFELCVLRLQL
jgi:hypothetical protein